MTLFAFVAVVLFALAVRVLPVAFGPWSNPTAVHHVDERILPYEALAAWEGIPPREIGWPAATTRLALSAAYAVDLVASSYPTLAGATSTTDAMEHVARWSADKLDNPERLFLIGRALSIAIGMCAVIAVYWTAARWTGRKSAWIAALVMAFSPLAITYSQYVLADMTGVLFATLALGLWARPLEDVKTAAAAGLLIGLAVASKHHFAVWLLPAAAWIVVTPGVARVRAVASLLCAAVLAYLLLVPWPWLNPVLFVKEVIGVVGQKVAFSSGDFWPFGPLANLRTAFLALGWLATAGILLGTIFLVQNRSRRWLPVAVALTAGIVELMAARIMFPRYGLLLLPAVCLLAAAGFRILLEAHRPALRWTGYVVLICATFATGAQLLVRQVQVGAEPPGLQAGQWLESHAKPGQRIAVHSVFPYQFPRARRQLESLVAEFIGESAYRRKMASNGYQLPKTSQPFHTAVLNDESYAAHWFLRELSIRHLDEGFEVVRYDEISKFDSIPAPDARRLFLAGLNDPNVGFDYYLTTWPFEDAPDAAKSFSSPGARTLYVYTR